MTRIVHVVGTAATGGAENQARYLIDAQRREGRSPELACFRAARGYDDFQALGVPIHHIAARRRLALDWRRRAAEMRRTFSSSPPDILHTWLFEAHIVGLVAAGSWPNTRVIVAQRSGHGAPEDGRHLLAMRPLRHRIDHAIANSNAGAELLEKFGLDPQRISIISNGLPAERVSVRRDAVDIRREIGVAPEVPIICAVARPDPTKDLPTLFAAFSRIRASSPRAALVLVGVTADEARRLSSQIPAGTHALGFDSWPADIMNASDVVVISSRTEGHSNVADEALMLGMPLAVTDTGDHVPIVREAGGRVVPVGRADLLGDAVLELLRSPPGRDSVRAVAHRRLSMSSVATATSEIYDRLVPAGRGKQS